MGNRIKEDDRIEKIIRGLLKLPENRRCINCNSLGPQYVCTTFLTFVCTNCSGVHREFTHRVKSVSVAKFSVEEVSALQVGGNERARQIYFREWDSQRHSFPDGSNLHRLREFIKHVYVDRKYTGERSTPLPRLRLSGKEEFNESRRVGGSRSSNEEDKYERYSTERSSPCGKNDDRSSKCYYDERRSPRYSREYIRHGSYKQSPVRFEIVDDRIRDDRFGNRRFSPGDSKLQRRLPNTNAKNADSSCSPIARPLQEILGDNVPTLQVGKISKEKHGEHADGFAHNQESVDGKLVEHKTGNLQSLIDFSTKTETTDAASISQTQLVSSFNNGSSSASAGLSAKQKSAQAPKVNTLESLLFGLSVPSVVPADDISEAPDSDVLTTAPGDNTLAADVAPPAPMQHMPELLESVYNVRKQPSIDNLLTESVANVPKQPSIDNLLEAASSSDTIVQQYQPPPSHAQGSSFTSQQTTLSIGFPNNESTVPSLAHNGQTSTSICVEQSSQSVSRTVQDTSVGVESEPLPVETKSSTRKELPADLFTTSFLPITTPVSCWQTGPPHGMGFNYYPNIMPVPAFPNPAKSKNPFDINDERTQVQATPFPSMGSLLGAPVGVLSAPTGLLHGSSLGPYSSPLNAPSGTALPPSAYIGQEGHNNIQATR
ncbi:probable ADP-ribosylation factor GTPase-activating protein AGD14 [Morus notabilis]|uniref:probable ADP-ribosylation factor GTPase-activating protein AGD14 n=1 Tax=Morus notabilis TaxID=981085 RepID=UPI000CED05E2|nr:probable ADP-ribosylation factor GTPase-activating protein AGD14 [Morus notabilis]